MNTNETQEIEIPPDADWIDPLKSWKRGFRAGVKAMRDAALREVEEYDPCDYAVDIKQVANKLLIGEEKE